MFWTSLRQSSLCCCFVLLGQKEGSMFSRPLDCIHFVFGRLSLMPFLVSEWCIQGLPVDCHFRGYKPVFELSLHVGGTWLNPNLWPRGFPPCGDFWVLCARDTKATKNFVCLKLKKTLMNIINIATSYNLETQFNSIFLMMGSRLL
jgi:hypothetical protein